MSPPGLYPGDVLQLRDRTSSWLDMLLDDRLTVRVEHSIGWIFKDDPVLVLAVIPNKCANASNAVLLWVPQDVGTPADKRVLRQR